MKIKKYQLIAILLVAILIAFIPLVSAAPAGTSESTVVAAAKGWIGVKSVHGGNSRSGIDCSHLVYQVYKQAGAKDIVFQTVPNMKKNAYYVTTASPKPGDVIFWKKDITKNNRNYWLTSHVGIYIGGGQFIDTSFETKTVNTESISGVYQEGMPYYARWNSGGSDDTDNDETPDNNDVNVPVAAFSISPNSGKAPLNVAFTDKSTDATSWTWSFGDGSTSTEKNPKHTYSEAGNYNVVLTVNNEKGSNSKTQKVIVQSEPAPEKVFPVANFNADTMSGSAPLSVRFTDISQNANEWNWNFGDGATSNEKSPTHTYVSAGNYKVVLTVNNGNGSSSKALSITVKGEPDQEKILPVANFNADTISGPAPLSVQFTDISQNANEWNWDFGDGATSNEQNPDYTYFSAGNYTVVLTVNNENGSSSKTLNINVEEEPDQEETLPVANFDADTTSGYAPLDVQFTDLSQNANEWYWNFGDGNTSTEQDPLHIYSSAGNYDVNLTVVNENKTSSKITTINVLEESNSSDSNSNSDTIGNSDSNSESDSNSDSDSNSESDSSSDSDSDSDSNSDSSGEGHSHKSGSSSGSIGGSPEPASNVQVKENLQNFIASGKDVNFNFTNNVTCVESIRFRSTKTVGKTTTIVEELKNKSSLVSKLPEGIVYKPFNIWVGNGGYGNSKNIESSSVNFKVNTSWVNENNINKSSILLDWYDDEKKEWIELPVNLTGEDDQFLHFTANVPGYSSFTITGTKDEGNTVTAELAQTATNNTTGSNAGNTASISEGSNASNNSSSSANTIENKAAEESTKSPGFSIISGIVCLFCIFLYRSKKR
jgi:PGF-pre-PGF domain-containing protein